MNLGELLDLAGFIVGKVDPGREVSPYEFNLLLKTNNIRHFKEKIGLPEEYRPGQPLPRQVPEITRKVANDLRPFKVYMGSGQGSNASPLSVDSGRADIPDDYYYMTGMNYRWIKNGAIILRPVDEVDDLEWSNRQSNPLTKGTKKNPICNFQSDHIRFQPDTIQFVEFTYYRLPRDPELAMRYSQGYYAYDADNSTQLEWDDINQLDILHKVLIDLGINLKSGDVIQYANMKKAQGS